MDESAFDIDQINLAAMVRKFPPRRHARAAQGARHEVSYAETSPRAEHARHAWDEGGHL